MTWRQADYTRTALIAIGFAAATLATAPTWATQFLRDNDGRRLELNIDGQFSPAGREQINIWVEKLAQSLTLVYGHWPREHWVMDIRPVSGSDNDPIPWARVHRGSVDRVSFYVVDNTRARVLLRQKTGHHEISHLLLPYRGWGDTWFSEGLASYYQNLLQARAGVIDEQEMWQQLYEGFVRGRDDSRFDGQPLLQVNRQMREHGGYMRVYWSGAWYFLAADLQLRKNSKGIASLDDALLHLNNCCARQSLSVPDIVDRLDEHRGGRVFADLYHQLRQSTRLPPFEALFEELGITIKDGEVQLQTQGQAAQRRRQFLRSTVL